ncbi:MAG: CDP-alcohol phosphatidyltransferase family protein [Phycisphaeraceae bacterium]|nr:CDP-alcohol phosphatidyltransferase family protein [Phycisphaerales bacterium]MCB9858956.1 CDP-alcohol phosphatidyltransferase family protein [Phycisphaeraceae bacterium]
MDTPQPQWKQRLPNTLSVARCFIAAGIIVVLATAPSPHHGVDTSGSMAADWRLIGCMIAFVVAAITDMLDGHLARRWNVVSKFGRIIDPFADKALVIGTLACLAGPAYTVFTTNAGENAQLVHITGVNVLIAVIVLIRELLVTSIRAVYESDGYDFSAGKFGKAKMILQSVCIPTVMLIAGLGLALPDSSWIHANNLMMWLTAGVTAVSAYPYVRRIGANS